MRPGKGCESCRERHVKCLTEKGRSACTRCLGGNRVCQFAPKFRFKEVAYVDLGSHGSRSRQSLTYGKHQVWVNTRKNCMYD